MNQGEEKQDIFLKDDGKTAYGNMLFIWENTYNLSI